MLSDKIAYVKGLADGLDFDKTTKEGKLLAALIDLCDEICAEVDQNGKDIKEVHEYCEELDEDLGDVEELLVDDEDDECDGDCENCECDGDCSTCEYGDEDDDGETFEIECPNCHEIINFTADLDPENLICPACGEKISCLVDADDTDFIEKIEK